MDKKNGKFVIPVLVFFAGWIYTENVWAGLTLMGFSFYIIWGINNVAIPTAEHSQNIFTQASEFTDMLLMLSAAVIKADGRIYEKERRLVRVRLAHNLSPLVVKSYMERLELYLQKEVLVEKVCLRVRNELDYPSKIQLLHFLTGLTVTNGLIIDSEFELLRKIVRLIDLPERSFVSVLAMFKYERIQSYDQHSRSRSSSTKPKPINALNNAYAILEINATATDEDVKKAYRKLAKIHHPDRVMHLGVEFQKIAKIKFQKIADAYDFIKAKRGFK